jgi:hypothetical protein
MINPDLERFVSKRARSETIELVGSHAIFLSHPREVAALIKKNGHGSEVATPIRSMRSLAFALKQTLARPYSRSES